MNISNNDKIALKKLVNSYSEIYDKIAKLEEKVMSALNEKNNLVSELDKIRQEEQKLINNIEDSLGRKIDKSELLQILS